MAASTIQSGDAGEEALELLRSAEPPLFLSPSLELSGSARSASRYLFSSLLPYCPKPPIDALLADESFDSEQIWSQIELLSRPIISSLRREVKRLEREASLVSVAEVKEVDRDEEKMKEDGIDDDDDDNVDDDDEDDDEEDDDDAEKEEDGEENDDGDDGDEVDEQEMGGENRNGVEDRFLKIKELEEYLKADEAREYGFDKKEGRTKRKSGTYVNDENEGIDEADEEGDEDDAEFGNLDSGDDEDAEDERYEDFFEEKKERLGKRKGGIKEKEAQDRSKDLLLDEKENDEMTLDIQNVRTLSTHEKEQLKIHSKIQEMEKANLEPKMWTMQGEVTATKRPKNSALEVDLDFEHNVKPPPVITEEVTAWIEDVIRKRIIEGHFDDVQRAPDLPSRAPKEFKEMVETKSKKGLAEIYEEEYAQKTGLTTAPISSSDEKMKEAAILYKKICLKLDALSHFQFAPKPVIEEMSIQTNIPALAMEEIAPVAVSDAAMLAPEEVFQGKGDVKEEAELSQSDRKRRRHNKKRRFKAEQTKREAKKARHNPEREVPNGKEES